MLSRYCLPDSFVCLFIIPETVSRVTLALLGIGFQPNPQSVPIYQYLSKYFLLKEISLD